MTADVVRRLFNSDDLYIYIIDTDKFAGSFEREMCAFITGIIGECGKGSKAATAAQEELEEEDFQYIEEVILSLPDDHGCNRPVSAFPNPRWYNIGGGEEYRYDQRTPKEKKVYPAYMSVAIFFGVMPPIGLLELMEKRAHEFVSRETLYEGEDETRRDSIGRLGINIEGFRLVKFKTGLEDCMPK